VKVSTYRRTLGGSDGSLPFPISKNFCRRKLCARLVRRRAIATVVESQAILEIFYAASRHA